MFRDLGQRFDLSGSRYTLSNCRSAIWWDSDVRNCSEERGERFIERSRILLIYREGKNNASVYSEAQ